MRLTSVGTWAAHGGDSASVGRGRGDVVLSVNDHPVPVHASGSWLAWVPLQPDSLGLMRFHIVARAAAGTGAEQGETTFVAHVARLYRPPAGVIAWIDTTSLTPAESLAFPAGEGIRLSVRATITKSGS